MHKAGFHINVAETMKDGAIFSLLPYVAAPMKPYALHVAKEVAPLLVETHIKPMLS
jgi:hypothetical protein